MSTLVIWTILRTTAFATLASGAAPLILMTSLTFDVTHPWIRVPQGAIAANAQADLKALFRPQSTFLASTLRNST